MFCNQSDYEFLHNLIQTAPNADEGKTSQKELFRYLVNKTGGKLYKYRFFDENGYSISNLENCTLYCAPPSAFNDPFDCKIGLDFRSLFEALYGLEQDKIEKMFADFLLVYNKKGSLDSYPQEEQNVICYWLNSKAIIDFVKATEKCTSETEVNNALMSNGNAIVEILIGATINPSLSSAMDISRDMISHAMAKILSDGSIDITSNEGVSFSDIAKRNGISDDTDEIAFIRLLSDKLQPEKHDTAVKLEEYYKTLEQQLNERLESLFLVGCLAGNYKNRLMWSHYADGHKGYCIEYDFSKTTDLDLLPFPVVYTDKRIKMPWKAIIHPLKEETIEASKTMMTALLTKDAEWSYEQEWRILVQHDNNPNVKMPKPSCVYIGSMCNEENRQRLCSIANSLSIPIKQMKIDRGEYALHAEDLNNF